MVTARTGTLVPPGAGASIELGLGRPTIKVGPSLNAQIGLVESELPPGGGFSIPHWHEDLYEVFYVLEGEIEFLLADGPVLAGPGTFVAAPPGAVHGFRTSGPGRARMLNVHGPDGGFVEMVRRTTRRLER